MAGVARAKKLGSLKPATSVKPMEEKEALIRQLHGEGKPVAAIVRMVGLTRITVLKALDRQKEAE